MSTAEVTAYLLGSQITATLAAALAGDHEAQAQADAPLGPDERVALDRLGPEQFAYWVLRGATEAAQ